jgi:uncharacterized protein
MLVVSDTSPLNGLFRIGHLHLLQLLFDRVIIPAEVVEELSAIEIFGFDPQKLLANSWIEIWESPENNDFREILDKGEAAAIALAKKLNADVLLIDELKARSVAKKEGFRVVGVLGVLLLAKVKGHIPLITPLMDALIYEVGFWIDHNLYTEMKSLAKE